MTEKLLTYDEKSAIRSFSKLQPRARAIGALLAATRIIPSYRRFSKQTLRGNAETLEELALRLWKDFLGEVMSPAELESAAEIALSLIPDENEGWDEETQAFAEDAASSLLYALRTRLSGDPQEAAWALRCVYEAMDYRAQQDTSLIPEDPAYETALLSHPAVQRELARQRRDLLDLETWEKSGGGSIALTELKARSEREGFSSTQDDNDGVWS